MLFIIWRCFLGLSAAAFVAFVLVNFLAGCERWDDPVCITPLEMIGW